MKFPALFLAFLASLLALRAQGGDLDRCNVTWTSQSKNSSESMPCGGGDIGLNVWVENGELLFYLSRSGSFDENNTLLKLGRVRLRLSNDPFGGADFRQELRLQEGYVKVSGGGTVVSLWVDVFRPLVHVDIQSEQALVVQAAYESWRDKDRVPERAEYRANSWKVPQSFEVLTRRDAIGFAGNAVRFVHRAPEQLEDIFDYTVRTEGMDSVKSQLFNPVRQRSFGGELRGTGFVPAGEAEGKYAGTAFKSWSLRSAAPTKNQALTLALHVAQTPSLADWEKGLAELWKQEENSRATAQQDTRAWWGRFWQRSHIFIEGDEAAWRLGRNYQLFRYMLGCNAYGEFPTKFNGGLFTFDPGYVDRNLAFTPDYRSWGGGIMTAQNQRLVYFPLFRSGDFDMLRPQFDFYLRSQRNAELRSQVYWKHGGACFTEQIENFGLPNVTEWGVKRPPGSDPGVEYNLWLEYEWDTVLEFCLMMLDTESYEGRDIAAYVPFVESCLAFFDEHYRMLAQQRGVKAFDGQGRYIFYPGSAAESYKMAYNASSTISGLRVVLTRLLALPSRYLDEARRARWTEMLGRIPPITLTQHAGHSCIAPAVAWERIQNSEAPQLYPVFPWGLYGVGLPDLEVARNTYDFDPQVQKYRTHVGWKQYNIWAARLGMTAEAKQLALLKLADGPHRFPAFWGPGHDWTPDHNWGGSGMIGLQEMLLQSVGDKLHLLPAWPKEWNVRFKLHAPQQTVVEAVFQNGVVTELKVTPESRTRDVVLPQ